MNQYKTICLLKKNFNFITDVKLTHSDPIPHYVIHINKIKMGEYFNVNTSGIYKGSSLAMLLILDNISSYDKILRVEQLLNNIINPDNNSFLYYES